MLCSKTRNVKEIDFLAHRHSLLQQRLVLTLAVPTGNELGLLEHALRICAELLLKVSDVSVQGVALQARSLARQRLRHHLHKLPHELCLHPRALSLQREVTLVFRGFLLQSLRILEGLHLLDHLLLLLRQGPEFHRDLLAQRLYLLQLVLALLQVGVGASQGVLGELRLLLLEGELLLYLVDVLRVASFQAAFPCDSLADMVHQSNNHGLLRLDLIQGLFLGLGEVVNERGHLVVSFVQLLVLFTLLFHHPRLVDVPANLVDLILYLLDFSLCLLHQFLQTRDFRVRVPQLLLELVLHLLRGHVCLRLFHYFCFLFPQGIQALLQMQTPFVALVVIALELIPGLFNAAVQVRQVVLLLFDVLLVVEIDPRYGFVSLLEVWPQTLHLVGGLFVDGLDLCFHLGCVLCEFSALDEQGHNLLAISLVVELELVVGVFDLGDICVRAQFVKRQVEIGQFSLKGPDVLYRLLVSPLHDILRRVVLVVLDDLLLHALDLLRYFCHFVP
mmetsp:Transcript_14757/g.29911  ORF Transcript_14757/g.29911 Transcript_14757/m.29911 type:complete len:502 (+) Transcript_14757:243-1748(+)